MVARCRTADIALLRLLGTRLALSFFVVARNRPFTPLNGDLPC
jgi:hypothetical protein